MNDRYVRMVRSAGLREAGEIGLVDNWVTDNPGDVLPVSVRFEDGTNIEWFRESEVEEVPAPVIAGKVNGYAAKSESPIANVVANYKPTGDPRFHALLKQLGELHDRKQQDYGTSDDPFANYRAAEDIGIPAWKNAFMRGIEKVNRIKAFIRNGKLANEGVEDAFMDLAVIAMIALIEFRETQK